MSTPYIETKDEIETSKTGGQRTTLNKLIPLGMVATGIVLGLAIATRFVDISITPKGSQTKAIRQVEITNTKSVDSSKLQSQVLPATGVTLPIQWGNLGKRMIDDGVIDETKFRAIFQTTLAPNEETMLNGSLSKEPIMTAANSRFLLDILWAFGLANKNEILEKGEMVDKQYGGAGNFASTGGWTLAKGKAMDHYSKHAYIVLTNQQQELVDRVSRGIFRPCCGNSTHFPDCNHGMAMLGLLELMAAGGADEQEMYSVALKVNAYWFPQTYLDLATYFEEQGTTWEKVDPKIVLGNEYSSAGGYQATRQKIQSLPKSASSGGGCGT